MQVVLQTSTDISIILRPGEGLANKTRVRGGAKAQQQKRKAAQEAEEVEARKHQRQMMDRLAALAEKALDKM